MAENRLLREPNPTPGEKPGFIPQHVLIDGVTYVKTGEGSPLPSQQYGVDDSGNKVPLKTDVNGNVLTKLSGSNMELYGLSTDIKPSTGLVVGTSFFEIDTTDAYMWDGTQWRLI